MRCRSSRAHRSSGEPAPMARWRSRCTSDPSKTARRSPERFKFVATRGDTRRRRSGGARRGDREPARRGAGGRPPATWSSRTTAQLPSTARRSVRTPEAQVADTPASRSAEASEAFKLWAPYRSQSVTLLAYLLRLRSPRVATAHVAMARRLPRPAVCVGEPARRSAAATTTASPSRCSCARVGVVRQPRSPIRTLLSPRRQLAHSTAFIVDLDD